MAPQTEIYPRPLEALLTDRMRYYPTVMVQGPRSVGKTTLLNNIGAIAEVPVHDLDDTTTRNLMLSDPTVFTSGPRPVLIDEYQRAPIVLDAIKAELNKNGEPGQFALTGSASFFALPRLAQSLTGRLHIMNLYPLTQAEIEESGANLVSTLFDSPEALRTHTLSKTTRADYARRIIYGGFPMAASQPNTSIRNSWFDDYVLLTLQRDALELRSFPRADRLAHLLNSLAGQTAQVLNVSRAARSIELDSNTAGEYIRLLEALFLLYRLPAWGTTLTSRSTKSPKIHILDSGIAARLLLVSEEKLEARDPSALTEYGHLLESFVVSELIRHASWLDNAFTLGHWRTHDNHEVDLVIERDDGKVVAVEVKASGRIDDNTYRSIRKLREAIPDRFHAGVVLYLGEYSIRTADGIYVTPVDALWRQITGEARD